jgi:hypothetical protein
VTKIPYLHRVPRGGRTYLYFRKGAYREGPLGSADGTPELRAEVDAILSRLAKAEAAAAKPAPNTIGGMLTAYNKSAEFLANARSTQRAYQDYIDEMIADFGNVILFEVTQAWLRNLRDAWAVRGHRAANNRMQVLKNALAPAITDQADVRIKGDPFHKLAKVRRPHDAPEAHPIWEDDEVAEAIEEAIARKTPGLARAIALGRWGGFRRATICAIPLNARPAGYDDDGVPHTRLLWITEKRKVVCDKREDPRLTALLERTPNSALTIAYNADGRPWKARQLNQAIDRLMARLARAGKVRSAVADDGTVYCPLDIHGLRHARGVEIAMAGGSDAEIMSQLEHATDRAAKIYRRQADRRRMADGAQDRVDKVVSLRAARKAKDAANKA